MYEWCVHSLSQISIGFHNDYRKKVNHRTLFIRAISRELNAREQGKYRFTVETGEPAFTFMRKVMPRRRPGHDGDERMDRDHCAKFRLERELPFFVSHHINEQYAVRVADTNRAAPAAKPMPPTHLDITPGLLEITVKLADVFLTNNNDPLTPTEQYKNTLQNRMHAIEGKARGIISRIKAANKPADGQVRRLEVMSFFHTGAYTILVAAPFEENARGQHDYACSRRSFAVSRAKLRIRCEGP